MTAEKSQFIGLVQASLSDQSFVKLSLGKCRGEPGLEKLLVTRVSIKDLLMLRFVYRYRTRDTTHNFAEQEGLEKLGELLGRVFLSGNLFTIKQDVCLLYNKRGSARINSSAPSMTKPLSTAHNRQKKTLVDAGVGYLELLGVTNKAGIVKASMAAKFKQIYRYVEILDSLIREGALQDCESLSVIDIGSGKGYLTFALYDHLVRTLKLQATVLGIEARPELVQLCNRIAQQSDFGGLGFKQGLAEQVVVENCDIVIALHACDTATDDAIYRGIAGDAKLIVCAPCCQHQLAPQLSAARSELSGVVRFGLFKQRQAELITDAARAVLLESAGYKIKVLEFIATEHTSKNVMIAGMKSSMVDRAAALAQYHALKQAFGFEQHALATLLGR